MAIKENDIALANSLIKSYDGKTHVYADKYLDSIALWDAKFGRNATHDHAMLFTSHYQKINGSKLHATQMI
ncbi:hypothetical protein CHS0354_003752 [Potamilus streckersoni]|uniref:Uncharacterized protein n=1 Tax=Potamilus streckersoni TaxID=2493646 RepID=A0AAE0RU33_9BIVA|nr:hypothetical protein CHS0354_003752 [Potamilus streckersoni]